MTERKIDQMSRVYDLRKHLHAATVKLVEEGYSDIEIKAYFKVLFSETNEFAEEYWAL
jgi:alkyl sulfatase BDS1-like metallo-beta-lactamase superfamily hydrolase